MGCCNGDMSFMRNTIGHLLNPEIENMIQMKETMIKFSKLSVIEIESKIYKHHYEMKLSAPQLRKALIELEFRIEIDKPVQDINTRLFRFLQNDQKIYDLRTVLICAVLLGRGKPTEKAEIIYNTVDVQKKNSLNEADIATIVDDTIVIAAQRLPMICADDNEDSETFFLPTTSVNDYCKGLMQNKEKVKTDIVQKILMGNKSISKTQFVGRFNEESTLKRYFWSSQVRMLLRLDN